MHGSEAFAGMGTQEFDPAFLNANNTKIIDYPGQPDYKMGICAPYVIFLHGDTVLVHKIDGAEGMVTTRALTTVRSYGKPFYDDIAGFVEYCGDGCRVGYIDTDEAGTIIYIYDNRDEQEVTAYPDGTEIPLDDRGYYIGGNFGYGLNLDIPGFSEWGYATMFPLAGEDDDERSIRQVKQHQEMVKLFTVDGQEPFIVEDGVQITHRSAAARD